MDDSELFNSTDNNVAYLTVREAARLTGRSEQILRRWMRPGPNGESPRLPAIREGKRRRLLLRSTDLEPLIGPQRPRQRGYAKKTVTLTWGDGSTSTTWVRDVKLSK